MHWIFAYLCGLTRILILYDIMCQYFVHLYARFTKSPHLHMPPGLTILRGIGQFHVHGHMAQCFPRYSLNFIPGAGVQDGEIIETLWNLVFTSSFKDAHILPCELSSSICASEWLVKIAHEMHCATGAAFRLGDLHTYGVTAS